MDCVEWGTFNVENLQPGKVVNYFAADVVWLLKIDLFVCQSLDCLSRSVGSCSGLRPVARGAGVTASLRQTVVMATTTVVITADHAHINSTAYW